MGYPEKTRRKVVRVSQYFDVTDWCVWVRVVVGGLLGRQIVRVDRDVLHRSVRSIGVLVVVALGHRLSGLQLQRFGPRRRAFGIWPGLDRRGPALVIVVAVYEFAEEANDKHRDDQLVSSAVVLIENVSE